MKKYLFTMLTLAVFAIGFAASDDEDSIAEDGYNDGYEIGFAASDDEDSIAENGYNDGYETGFAMGESFPDDVLEFDARTKYEVTYGAPTTKEEKEQFRIYKTNYKKGFRDGVSASAN